MCLLDGDNNSASIDIEDIASESFFKLWKEIAAENEEIYEKVNLNCFIKQVGWGGMAGSTLGRRAKHEAMVYASSERIPFPK